MGTPNDSIFENVWVEINARSENVLEFAAAMQTSEKFYYPMDMIYENETSQWAEIRMFICCRENDLRERDQPVGWD